MRVVENVTQIIEEKRWLQKTITGFLYGSIRQRSLMSTLLQKKMNKCNNMKDYVNLAFGTRPNIRPVQVTEEITELMEILEMKRPKFVLEIGTARGGTLFLISRAASSDATIISLDLPDFSYKTSFYETFATQGQKMYFIRKDSHLPQTFQFVQGILQGRKLDFLFIDGDHTYNGVKKDFEMYSKLVEKGGMIAFHDICAGPLEVAGEVNKFWNEIKQAYSFKEIIHDRNEEGFGIGILYT